MIIIKRDGRKVQFNPQKIIDAVLAAFREVEGETTEYAESKARNIADYITNIAKEKEPKHEYLSVEEIQDLVESGLMSTKKKNVAKAYILYRDERNRNRGNSTDDSVLKLLDKKNEYWNKENSNKDANIVSVQRDYIAGITSTDIARRLLLPKEVREAHDQGIIHEHDMDYLAQKALSNCCLINLEDMLQNGTVINKVKIDPPHKLLTAATISTQIITAVASSQYGGCTVTLTALAPFVKKSFDRYYQKYINRGFAKEESLKWAKEDLETEITDAVQTFNYQINSMSTTNGQAPFVSVAMYLGETEVYKEELAMLIEEFLKQRIIGMKNRTGQYITQAFPKLLYFLEEDNIKEDSPYYYLTKLAAQCSAKRLTPDYISVKQMKLLKINPSTQKGEVFPCMGCRSFLSADRTTKNWAKALNYDSSRGKYYGRFNLGVTTINLADLAFSSEKNIDKFWELFEERTELCHKGLRVRIKRLEEITADAAPIMWQDGALARLAPKESLKDIIHHGYATASLGYAALYECVKYMTGHSHTDNGEGYDFAIKVLKALNEKCEQWKQEEDIDYSLYGSPIETVTYKFAKTLKKRFGEDVFIKLDGRDRNYITNSYHVPVFEKIDAFSKLKIESEFQKHSTGGAISYIETPNMQKNIPAVLEIIKYIYENIMYAEINTKSDYCQECGYTGEILIDETMNWYCPNCGNRDQTKMNVARRTCG